MSINSKIRRAISLTTRLGRLTYRISRQFETGGLSDCGINTDSGAFLYQRACQQTPNGDVVEIGSCYGRSTLYLAAGVQTSGRGYVWAVDPHTGDCSWDRTKNVSTYEIFLHNIHKFGFYHQVRPLKMTSQEAAAQWTDRPIRLLFIDGWHSYERS